MAAAITARGLFSFGDADAWNERSGRYRAVWAGVLLAGVLFGLLEVKPIPAIIAAQAFNGVLLPMVAIFLFLVVNDRSLVGERGLNGAASNTFMGIVILVTIVLGVSKTLQALTSAFRLGTPDERLLFAASGVFALASAVPIVRAARRRRSW
jgi:Mn2+/Fe2+ NRAMP family transporter